MGRLFLIAAAVVAMWFAYAEVTGKGGIRVSSGNSTPFGGMSKAPSKIVGAVTQ